MQAPRGNRTGSRLRRDAAASRRTVALCGRSLFMSSFGASLRGRAHLKVLAPGTSASWCARRVRELQADAVVFDLAVAPPGWTRELLQARPGIVLVGVDPGSDEILLFSAGSGRVCSGDDLLRVIEAHPGAGDGSGSSSRRSPTYPATRVQRRGKGR